MDTATGATLPPAARSGAPHPGMGFKQFVAIVAAMMAAVAIGAYPSMEACLAAWVVPLLGPPEPPDPALVAAYDDLFPAYLAARRGLAPAWAALARRPLPGDAP